MRRLVPALVAVADAIEARLRNPTFIDSRAIGIDTRALAAFRIVVGLLLVADVFARARNFSFYYTDDGFLTQELAERMTVDGAFSVFFYTSDTTVIAALFVITAIVGIQLAVGYETRVATVLAFLLAVSFDHHNPLVTSYADTLYRLLLFWGIFLPLGERWSVDAVHSDSSPRRMVIGLASAAILVQMITMYVVNGIHKTESELWTSGIATPLIMGLDDMTFLLAGVVRNVPTLLQYGGLLWFYMLLFAWALVLLRGRARIAFVGLFIGGHASFAVTVRIGAFAYVAIAGLLLFLPPLFWDRAADVASEVERRLRDRTTIPLSRADLRRTANRLPHPRIGSPATDRVWRVTLTVVLFLAVASMLVVPTIQLAPVDADVDGTHDAVDDTVTALSIDQPEWSVFAPHPRTGDRYYVFPAMTEDGQTLDLYNDRELTYERPYDELQNQYGTYRERFFMNSIRRGGPDDVVAAAYADHLCETWAEERDVEVTHINMFYVREDIRMDSIDDPDARDRDHWQFYAHGCGDNEPEEFGAPDDDWS